MLFSGDRLVFLPDMPCSMEDGSPLKVLQLSEEYKFNIPRL